MSDQTVILWTFVIGLFLVWQFTLDWQAVKRIRARQSKERAAWALDAQLLSAAKAVLDHIEGYGEISREDKPVHTLRAAAESKEQAA